MSDRKKEHAISEMITGIKTMQQQLHLTNRAILDFMGMPAKLETDFFSGKATLNDYEQARDTLIVIQQSLRQLSVPLTAYLAQLRALPLHNIFLRNRYAFWFANYVEAGGSADLLVRDAKENGFEIIEQIIWSGNLLVSTAGVAHIQTHQKQLVTLSDSEYQIIRLITERFSNVSPLFFFNLSTLHKQGVITANKQLQQYWDQDAELKESSS